MSKGKKKFLSGMIIDVRGSIEMEKTFLSFN